MEFSEKLLQLRKAKEMTQEDLAKALFVSRTAISKWESGRGYPSIDSLRTIAEFFDISVDELLSGNELLSVAQKEKKQQMHHVQDLVFGLLDCSVAMFLFLPFFGQHINGEIEEVSLLNYNGSEIYVLIPYMILVFGTILWGILLLALQNVKYPVWTKSKKVVSITVSAISSLLFMFSLQPYAAAFTFLFLIIKGILLFKGK